MKTGGFDILGSPELCELMAYNINAGNTYKEFKLILDNENKQLMMSYESANMPNYLKFTINLTCSICSVSRVENKYFSDSFKSHPSYPSISIFQKTVFQPVALKCGHMFCYMCACHVASVSIFHGLELANNRQMCSVCKKVNRQTNEQTKNDSYLIFKLRFILMNKLHTDQGLWKNNDDERSKPHG